VVEEERLGQRLRHVDDEIMPPDVCQLVREDGVDLRRREIRQRGDGHQDHRLHPSNDCWRIDVGAVHDDDEAAQADQRRESRRRAVPA
jgi:hypothetical protein